MERLKSQLTPQQWSEVDKQIFASYRVYAIDLIQRFSGAEIGLACQLFELQAQHLRSEVPERFQMSADERHDIASDFVAVRNEA